MIVKFSTKEVNLSERVLGMMENKLHMRLDKYFKTRTGEETMVLVKITEKKPVFTVEISLHYGGYLLRTEVSDKNGALSALDKAIDTMERQVTKCKERLALRKKVQKVTSAVADVTEEAEEREEYKVVKIKKYEMKPMAVQEAILQMEFLGHNFYVFSNIENGKVCTAYRRNDGDYGLIEPEN